MQSKTINQTMKLSSQKKLLNTNNKQVLKTSVKSNDVIENENINKIEKIISESHIFTNELLSSIQSTFKSKLTTINKDFNPVESIQTLYSKLIIHLEEQTGRIILKFLSSKIDNATKQKIIEFYDYFKTIINFIYNISMNINSNTVSKENQTINLTNFLMNIITKSNQINQIISKYIWPIMSYYFNILSISHKYINDLIKFVPVKFHNEIKFITNNIENLFSLFYKINLPPDNENHSNNPDIPTTTYDVSTQTDQILNSQQSLATDEEPKLGELLYKVIKDTLIQIDEQRNTVNNMIPDSDDDDDDDNVEDVVLENIYNSKILTEHNLIKSYKENEMNYRKYAKK